MGLHARAFAIPGRSAGVPAWDDVPADRRALYARYMELYAAIVDNIDQNIGRLTQALAKLGRLDNTVVIVTSDNGANGIGGVDGAVNNLAKRLTRTEDAEVVRRTMAEGRLGAADTWPAYPLGWTDVSSAPFRLYKTTTMNGGIRVPFVAHWPARIRDGGAIRHAWMHVTDIVPTLLDAIGVAYPDHFHEHPTRGLDGVSALPLLTSGDAASARTRQHYELAGNRGYILDGWKIVSLQAPGKPMDLDNWMLFDLAADPTETNDLAASNPPRLAELVAAFDADAQANYVYPLDNRDVRRSLTIPPFREAAVATPRTFYPGSTAALCIVAPLVADRDYRIECRFTHDDSDSGVVFALGDPLAGMALFARRGTLCFVYHGGTGKPVVCDGLRVPAGPARFELRHDALGERKGRGTLLINGDTCATLDMSPTTILGLGVGEGLDIGLDRKLHVTHLYGGDGCCGYTGIVEYVRIEPGAHPAGSYANRRERDSPRD
jgi:arylsulfatase